MPTGILSVNSRCVYQNGATFYISPRKEDLDTGMANACGGSSTSPLAGGCTWLQIPFNKASQGSDFLGRAQEDGCILRPETT